MTISVSSTCARWLERAFVHARQRPKRRGTEGRTLAGRVLAWLIFFTFYCRAIFYFPVLVDLVRHHPSWSLIWRKISINKTTSEPFRTDSRPKTVSREKANWSGRRIVLDPIFLCLPNLPILLTHYLPVDYTIISPISWTDPVQCVREPENLLSHCLTSIPPKTKSTS